jgi:hypothetical protein
MLYTVYLHITTSHFPQKQSSHSCKTELFTHKFHKIQSFNHTKTTSRTPIQKEITDILYDTEQKPPIHHLIHTLDTSQ